MCSVRKRGVKVKIANRKEKSLIEGASEARKVRGLKAERVGVRPVRGQGRGELRKFRKMKSKWRRGSTGLENGALPWELLASDVHWVTVPIFLIKFLDNQTVVQL